MRKAEDEALISALGNKQSFFRIRDGEAKRNPFHILDVSWLGNFQLFLIKNHRSSVPKNEKNFLLDSSAGEMFITVGGG